MKIKCVISIGYPTANHEVEWSLEDLDLAKEDWDYLTYDEKQDVLECVLRDELDSILETSIWAEE